MVYLLLFTHVCWTLQTSGVCVHFFAAGVCNWAHVMMSIARWALCIHPPRTLHSAPLKYENVVSKCVYGECACVHNENGLENFRTLATRVGWWLYCSNENALRAHSLSFSIKCESREQPHNHVAPLTLSPRLFKPAPANWFRNTQKATHLELRFIKRVSSAHAVGKITNLSVSQRARVLCIRCARRRSI